MRVAARDERNGLSSSVGVSMFIFVYIYMSDLNWPFRAGRSIYLGSVTCRLGENENPPKLDADT